MLDFYRPPSSLAFADLKDVSIMARYQRAVISSSFENDLQTIDFLSHLLRIMQIVGLERAEPAK